MMTLNECKYIFYIVGLIGVFLCFSQSFVRVLYSHPQNQFSALYVLGPNKMAQGYPFELSNNTSYNVTLGVENHMGCSMYYGVDVKFRNASELLPTGNMASPLPSRYNYTVFLGDGQVWEGSLSFSFSFTINETVNCSVGKMQLNNVLVQLEEPTIWDNANKGFYYELFVELWTYNETGGGLIYNNRFVGLWLNMTS